MLFIILVCLVSYLVYKFFSNRERSSTKNIPAGPGGVKTLMLLLSGMIHGDLHHVARTWAKEYGEIVLCRTLIGNICFLNSARAVRLTYNSKDTEAVTNERPKTFTGWFASYNNKSLLTSISSTKEWASMRKLFHTSIKLYGDGVDRFESTVHLELARLMDSLGQSGKEDDIQTQCFDESSQQIKGKEVDVQDLITNSLARVIHILVNV